jgi:hypothetical protein
VVFGGTPKARNAGPYEDAPSDGTIERSVSTVPPPRRRVPKFAICCSVSEPAEGPFGLNLHN